ncbi:hypothetical protein CJU89_6591 [Yarrowia sp. B02]|nr:hypothetical protein CJU89_6591 [Yarrowia sp. B02]
MRPSSARPVLDALRDLLAQGIAATNDKGLQKRFAHIRYLMLDLYERLVCTMNTHLTHAHWAWGMRVIVEKCLRDIMALNDLIYFDFSRWIYDLVRSLFVGYVGAPVPEERRLRFPSDRVPTFRDAYEITVAYFGLFDDEKALQMFIQAYDDADSALEALREELNDDPGLVVEEAAESTRFAMTRCLWDMARAGYYAAKPDGIVYDLDSVFEEILPPFPDHIVMDLAMIVQSSCGWIPVGQDSGIFSDMNMMVEHRTRDVPGPLYRFAALLKAHGNPQMPWQNWWMGLNVAQKMVAQDRLTYVGPGRIDVPSVPTKKVLARFQAVFPEAKDLSPAVQKYVAHQFYLARILHSEFVSMFEKNEARIEALQVAFLKKLRAQNEKSYKDLVTNNFYLDKFIEGGKVHVPSCLASEGQLLKKLPFREHLEKLQADKELFFFRAMFTNDNVEIQASFGMFLEACGEYAKRKDPDKWYMNDDWVKWRCVMGKSEVIIEDERLFLQPGTPAEKRLEAGGRVFLSTKKGEICYAYDSEGKGLYAQAYYCPKGGENVMPWDKYDAIKSVVPLQRPYNMFQLPVLKSEERLGQENVISWRGYELNLDMTYWHKHLGHASRWKLKRYKNVIRGMPPYLWQAEPDCTCV